MTTHARIDTHHPIVPPAYAAGLERHGVAAGGLAIPRWSVDGALDLMDASGITNGIFPVSTPAVSLGRREAGSFLAVLPGQLAQVFARHGHFVSLKLAVALLPTTVRVHWHRRFNEDAGNGWLRRVVATESSAMRGE